MVNGDTSTPSVSYGGNINSSVTKSSTGRYLFTFTTSMPSANYVVTATIADNEDDENIQCYTNILSSSQFEIRTYDEGFATSAQTIFFTVFG
jgi:hypothetical protein